MLGQAYRSVTVTGGPHVSIPKSETMTFQIDDPSKTGILLEVDLSLSLTHTHAHTLLFMFGLFCFFFVFFLFFFLAFFLHFSHQNFTRCGKTNLLNHLRKTTKKHKCLH